MSESVPSTTGWQLASNAAEAYQAYLVPAFFGACSERLVALAGIARGQRVLDLACGTGAVARAAARRVGPGGEVVGADVNAEMLATAERVGAPPGSRVRWEEADAAALPFPSDAFDHVLCQQGLQFFADPVAALREARRVLAPGARATLSVFRSLERHPAYAAFARLLGEHVGPEAARTMASPFALGDADAVRALMDEAGWRTTEVRIVVGETRFPSVAELVRREAASSPLAGSLARLDPAAVAALVAAAGEALAPHVDDGGVAFPNETHVVHAEA